ncbi:MAG: DUF2202 domain-containing protein [Chloroflexota bacterium]|nr:DUF2202 domain-containing protein [Chloroflexota bacterium]
MRIFRTLSLSALAGFTALSMIACGLPAAADTMDTFAAPVLVTAVTTTSNTPAVVQQASGELSSDEAGGLQFMREEEKLARDVYLTLYEQWGQRIFQNIARSEQTHMDAVLRLIDSSGIEDPAAGNDVGVFTDPDLQALYDGLVNTGSQSLADALKVGAAIEEIDILDLEEYLAQTDNPDIQEVYTNLLKGSGNHLRAFVRTLERQAGEIYQPQYMDQAGFDKIIASSNQMGGRGKSGQGHGKSGHGDEGAGGHDDQDCENEQGGHGDHDDQGSQDSRGNGGRGRGRS